MASAVHADSGNAAGWRRACCALINACLTPLLKRRSHVLMSHPASIASSTRPQAMAAVWGVGEHIQCIHPVSGVIAGRDDVSRLTHPVLTPLLDALVPAVCFDD